MLKAGISGSDKEEELMRRVRKNLDDEFELHQSFDDPKVLQKIADDNNVLSEYNLEIQKYSWLEPRLSRRFNEIEDNYKLSFHLDGLKAVRERAMNTIDMLNLLYEFESIPGIIKVMDIAKLEEIVPFETRSKILLDTLETSPNFDERDLKFSKKKLLKSLKKTRLIAGTNNPRLSKIAEEFHIFEEFERRLREIVELSESKSTFVELMPLSSGAK